MRYAISPEKQRILSLARAWCFVCVGSSFLETVGLIMRGSEILASTKAFTTQITVSLIACRNTLSNSDFLRCIYRIEIIPEKVKEKRFGNSEKGLSVQR
jgi:hypothetical protein